MLDAHTDKWSSKRVRAIERWGAGGIHTAGVFPMAGKAGPQNVVKCTDTQPDRRQSDARQYCCGGCPFAPRLPARLGRVESMDSCAGGPSGCLCPTSHSIGPSLNIYSVNTESSSTLLG